MTKKRATELTKLVRRHVADMITTSWGEPLKEVWEECADDDERYVADAEVKRICAWLKTAGAK